MYIIRQWIELNLEFVVCNHGDNLRKDRDHLNQHEMTYMGPL